MIILDIETTGVSPIEHSMLSLGAVDYDSGEEFYGECRADFISKISFTALEINGYTLEQATDPSKIFPWELYFNFYEWSNRFEDKLLGGHNIGHFDVLFCEKYHEQCGTRVDKWPFGYRTLDLHSVAYTKFGQSLKHADICLKLGLPVEASPHNALGGARSECAAFRKLLE